MGLFDSNVLTMRRVFEHTWRRIAQEAAALDLLDLELADVEIRIVLKVKGRKHIESRTKVQLSAKDQAKVKSKKGATLWRRLMQPDDAGI